MFNQERLEQIHGVDEYITWQEYHAMLRFYESFIKKIGTNLIQSF